MTVALWLVSIPLAVLFALTGTAKLVQDRGALVARGWAWAATVPPHLLRALGTAEVLGAAGLVLPRALGVAPVLAPLAATGLLLVMAGAVVTHGRRGEPVGTNLVIGALCATAAVLGFVALTV